MDQTLGVIETPLSAQEAKSRMQTLSKKGKLPGFVPECDDGLFSVAAHGMPFDSVLIFNHRDGALMPTLKLARMMPTIFAILLMVTIWPGLPLTEGFLGSFQWYTDLAARFGIETWYWYLPLTILPTPFVWRNAIRKSKQSAFESARETMDLARKVLDVQSDS